MAASATEPPTLDLPGFDDHTSVNELLEAVGCCDRGESYLAYARYLRAEQILCLCCDQIPEEDERVLDAFANTAARLATVRRISQRGAEAMLGEACALVNRIPKVGCCLRDGIISPWQFRALVSRTDLIEDMSYASAVDAAIAGELRRTGAWSKKRLQDMADRMICRHDPDAVRRRREAAKDQRGVWTNNSGDGMAEIGINASAEDVVLAVAAIDALARSVCAQDPRTMQQRRSDAAICRLQQQPFECLCDAADCDADIPGQGVSDRQAQIVLHVICERSTLEGDNGSDGKSSDGKSSDGKSSDGRVDDADPADNADGCCEPAADEPAADGSNSDGPGFLDGHGVISADHVRDIAARLDTLIRYLNPDPGGTLPACLPSNPYRLSTALDTYIRARDGYCTFPGCIAPAWSSDIDHVTEYDHHNPAEGGATCVENCQLRCRFHHLLKTFGNWLDDQYIDTGGNTHIEIRTPEGFAVASGGHTNEELFPALRSIRFANPGPAKDPPQPCSNTGPDRADHGIGMPAGSDSFRAGPQRRRPRTEEKHARRRYERQKNRDDREFFEAQKAAEPGRNEPPPF